MSEETKAPLPDGCQSGCKHFYGGEVKHHKDCQYYHESLSKMYDDQCDRIAALEAENKRLREALEFHATEWCDAKHPSDMRQPTLTMLYDTGDVAIAALAQTGEKS